MHIHLTIDGNSVDATLNDSSTVRDFAALLPLALDLDDFQKTERIADLPRKLSIEGAPASSEPKAGDLAFYAPWGNLALFYRDGHPHRAWSSSATSPTRTTSRAWPTPTASASSPPPDHAPVPRSSSPYVRSRRSRAGQAALRRVGARRRHLSDGHHRVRHAGILPDIAPDLGASVSHASLLITAFAVGMIVGGPTMALATLRLPQRLTLVLALAVFAGPGPPWSAPSSRA